MIKLLCDELHKKCLLCIIILLGLQLLITAIEKAGYTGKIKIGMDVAASEFCKDGKYDLDFKNAKSDAATYVRVTLLIF